MERSARGWWPGWIAIAFDALIVFVAHLASLLLRFEGQVPQPYWRNFMASVPLVAGIYIGGNLIARGYGGDALRRVPAAALLSARTRHHALGKLAWSYPSAAALRRGVGSRSLVGRVPRRAPCGWSRAEEPSGQRLDRCAEVRRQDRGLPRQTTRDGL
jgi:hypothetical protein